MLDYISLVRPCKGFPYYCVSLHCTACASGKNVRPRQVTLASGSEAGMRFRKIELCSIITISLGVENNRHSHFVSAVWLVVGFLTHAKSEHACHKPELFFCVSTFSVMCIIQGPCLG
jgi:hypothetical protein